MAAVVLAAMAQESLPRARSLVGSEFEYTVRKGDSFASLGSRYAVEPAVLAALNGLKPNTRLGTSQTIRIDNRHLVPGDLEDGILINLPQRLQFFFRNGALVSNYPVGPGKSTWPTPSGSFQVLQLRKNPTWYVPRSIQSEMARVGKIVKRSVPPGRNNPLGGFWIGLSFASYGIHGTTAPLTIYDFKSHGCIRMHQRTHVLSSSK